MKQRMRIHTSWLKPMMEMSWGWKSRYHTSCRILSWTCWPPLLPPPMMMLHNLKPTHSFLYSCQCERGSTLCFEVCHCKLFLKLYWSEQWTVPHTIWSGCWIQELNLTETKESLTQICVFFSNQRCTVHCAHWANHDVLNEFCAALSSMSNYSLL